MRLLLDTHILIWWMEDSLQLSARARQLITDADEIFVSSATIWETAIKTSIGKLQLDAANLAAMVDRQGFERLGVSYSHAIRTAQLPLHHRDPFDRLLVAQAITEGMQLLTADAHLAAYSDLVVVA